MKAKHLIIWTIPPSYKVLKLAVDKVAPSVIHLFANDPGMNELEPFLMRLAGLVKYVVSSMEGIITLTELAQAAAQTEALTLLGLSWLETEGQISINQSGDGWLKIQREHIPVLSLGSASINEEIKLLMNESRLFQEYYLTASPDNFIKAFGSKS